MLDQTAEVEGILPPIMCEPTGAHFPSVCGYALGMSLLYIRSRGGRYQTQALQVLSYQRDENTPAALLPPKRGVLCETLRPEFQSKRLPLGEGMTLENGSEQPPCDLPFVGYLGACQEP